jgi:hypothetical protein
LHIRNASPLRRTRPIYTFALEKFNQQSAALAADHPPFRDERFAAHRRRHPGYAQPQENRQMIRKTLFAATALALLAGPAFAFQCPTDMAKIDAALQTAMLTPEAKAEVEALRAQGEEQHNAGDHDASVATLATAMQILGIN